MAEVRDTLSWDVQPLISAGKAAEKAVSSLSGKVVKLREDLRRTGEEASQSLGKAFKPSASPLSDALLKEQKKIEQAFARFQALPEASAKALDRFSRSGIDSAEVSAFMGKRIAELERRWGSLSPAVQKSLKPTLDMIRASREADAAARRQERSLAAFEKRLASVERKPALLARQISKWTAEGRKADDIARALSSDLRQMEQRMESLPPKIRAVIAPTAELARQQRQASLQSHGLGTIFRSQLASVGQLAIGYFGLTAAVLALINALRRLVGESIRFERTFANVKTLLDQSRAATSAMRRELIGLSAQLGSSTELSQGLYQALSASVEPAQAVAFVGETAKFARAGLIDMTAAVDVTTTVLNAYGLEASRAAEVNDKLFQIIKRGKVTGQELAGSLGTVIPTAAVLNVSLDEVGAAIATMTRGGIRADESVTALNRTLLSFLDPSDEARTAAKRLGIELSAASLRSKGLLASLREMAERTDGNSEATAALFGNVRALKAVLALTGPQAAGFAKDVALMGSATGTVNKAFDEQVNALGPQMDALWNNLSSNFLSASDNASTLTVVIRGLNDALDELRKSGSSLGDIAGEASLRVPEIGPRLAILKAAAAIFSGLKARRENEEAGASLLAVPAPAGPPENDISGRLEALALRQQEAFRLATGEPVPLTQDEEKIVEAFRKALKPADELAEKLAVLRKRFTDAEIAAGEAQELERVAQAFKDAREPVPQFILDLQRVNAQNGMLTSSQRHLRDAFNASFRPLDAFVKRLSDANAAGVSSSDFFSRYGAEILQAMHAQEDFGNAASKSAKRLLELGRAKIGEALRRDFERAGDPLFALTRQISDLASVGEIAAGKLAKRFGPQIEQGLREALARGKGLDEILLSLPADAAPAFEDALTELFERAENPTIALGKLIQAELDLSTPFELVGDRFGQQALEAADVARRTGAEIDERVRQAATFALQKDVQAALDPAKQLGGRLKLVALLGGDASAYAKAHKEQLYQAVTAARELGKELDKAVEAEFRALKLEDFQRSATKGLGDQIRDLRIAAEQAHLGEADIQRLIRERFGADAAGAAREGALKGQLIDPDVFAANAARIRNELARALNPTLELGDEIRKRILAGVSPEEINRQLASQTLEAVITARIRGLTVDPDVQQQLEQDVAAGLISPEQANAAPLDLLREKLQAVNGDVTQLQDVFREMIPPDAFDQIVQAQEQFNRLQEVIGFAGNSFDLLFNAAQRGGKAFLAALAKIVGKELATHGIRLVGTGLTNIALGSVPPPKGPNIPLIAAGHRQVATGAIVTALGASLGVAGSALSGKGRGGGGRGGGEGVGFGGRASTAQAEPPPPAYISDLGKQLAEQQVRLGAGKPPPPGGLGSDGPLHRLIERLDSRLDEADRQQEQRDAMLRSTLQSTAATSADAANRMAGEAARLRGVDPGSMLVEFGEREGLAGFGGRVLQESESNSVGGVRRV